MKIHFHHTSFNSAFVFKFSVQMTNYINVLMRDEDEKLRSNKWKALQKMLGLTITIDTVYTIHNQFIVI